MTAYLDNSATTKPCEACVNAVNKMLTESWGNPSSLHSLGVGSAKEIILARTAVAESLGA
ncbi:MAG: aminotransferase class V-fold PLP-dependent enzyme, partial [Eubacterium sp.]|nr:aminotransferase class V-fold PLP-dependent enzyme [Eubacterium sp.]